MTTLPIHGVWTIHWNATFVKDEKQATTPPSVPVMVDLSSERSIIPGRREEPKEFANIGRTLQNVPEEVFANNFESIEKRDKVWEVSWVVQSSGNLLVEDGVLEESDVKQFKVCVKSLIQSGEEADWIRSITEEELQSLGGTSNRLFQLLANNLWSKIDLGTISAAFTRLDLLTTKQLKVFLRRRLEILKYFLESGEAAEWIQSVRKEDLGVTSNRLFELLVDDQWLEIDPVTLSAACTRHDLFTPKQCKRLETVRLERKDKMKAKLNRFKVRVQDHLKSGEAAKWIQSVTKDELHTLDGMPYRLINSWPMISHLKSTQPLSLRLALVMTSSLADNAKDCRAVDWKMRNLFSSRTRRPNGFSLLRKKNFKPSVARPIVPFNSWPMIRRS